MAGGGRAARLVGYGDKVSGRDGKWAVLDRKVGGCGHGRAVGDGLAGSVVAGGLIRGRVNFGSGCGSL